jgi:hypothetical protein
VCCPPRHGWRHKFTIQSVSTHARPRSTPHPQLPHRIDYCTAIYNQPASVRTTTKRRMQRRRRRSAGRSVRLRPSVLYTRFAGRHLREDMLAHVPRSFAGVHAFVGRACRSLSTEAAATTQAVRCCAAMTSGRCRAAVLHPLCRADVCGVASSTGTLSCDAVVARLLAAVAGERLQRRRCRAPSLRLLASRRCCVCHRAACCRRRVLDLGHLGGYSLGAVAARDSSVASTSSRRPL